MSNSQPRWAIFAGSIISAVDNPDAALFRALGRHLAQRGHQATFYEERGNPRMRALLQHAGAQGLESFRRSHPEITYRTLDPRSGAGLVESLTLLLATVDIALVQRDTPTDIALWLGRLTRPHLQTYLIDTGHGVAHSDLTLESREPHNFSGVLIASEQLAERYHRWVSPDRLHHFGPLLENLGVGTTDTAELHQTAVRLVDQILTVFGRDRTRDLGVGHSNGRAP